MCAGPARRENTGLRSGESGNSIHGLRWQGHAKNIDWQRGNVDERLECAVVAGHEVKAIVDFAAQGGFDLLVAGFTGHSAVYEHLWGGTSHNLTRMAHCSVLVVK
jgi:hypothetical protein